MEIVRRGELVDVSLVSGEGVECREHKHSVVIPRGLFLNFARVFDLLAPPPILGNLCPVHLGALPWFEGQNCTASTSFWRIEYPSHGKCAKLLLLYMHVCVQFERANVRARTYR